MNVVSPKRRSSATGKRLYIYILGILTVSHLAVPLSEAAAPRQSGLADTRPARSGITLVQALSDGLAKEREHLSGERPPSGSDERPGSGRMRVDPRIPPSSPGGGSAAGPERNDRDRSAKAKDRDQEHNAGSGHTQSGERNKSSESTR